MPDLVLALTRFLALGRPMKEPALIREHPLLDLRSVILKLSLVKGIQSICGRRLEGFMWGSYIPLRLWAVGQCFCIELNMFFDPLSIHKLNLFIGNLLHILMRLERIQ